MSGFPGWLWGWCRDLGLPPEHTSGGGARELANMDSGGMAVFFQLFAFFIAEACWYSFEHSAAIAGLGGDYKREAKFARCVRHEGS